jgi:high-affinity nickel-transport protein
VHELPADFGALLALVFLLGVKHGFDADHLATIDGLTRFNARAGRRIWRWCGALFSLGHGVVVMAIALAVGLASERWDAPAWLELSGAVISVLFLLTLGVINLRAVLAAGPGVALSPQGLKGRYLGRLVHAARPGSVALVGALFALSFDTVSQTALFAAAGVQVAGAASAVLLGAVFTAGMLATDAANGLWIARLIARADSLAVVASRVMSLAVAAISLLVAALGVARLVSPWADDWAAGRGLVFSVALLVVPAVAYALARLLAASAKTARGHTSAPAQ